jgi:hypothetical protein
LRIASAIALLLSTLMNPFITASGLCPHGRVKRPLYPRQCNRDQLHVVRTDVWFSPPFGNMVAAIAESRGVPRLLCSRTVGSPP